MKTLTVKVELKFEFDEAKVKPGVDPKVVVGRLMNDQLNGLMCRAENEMERHHMVDEAGFAGTESMVDVKVGDE